MAATPPVPDETTPVADVRRVRARIEREANGRVDAIAEQSRAAFERYREILNLELVPAPQSAIDRSTPAA